MGAPESSENSQNHHVNHSISRRGGRPCRQSEAVATPQLNHSTSSMIGTIVCILGVEISQGQYIYYTDRHLCQLINFSCASYHHTTTCTKCFVHGRLNQESSASDLETKNLTITHNSKPFLCSH
jgi:hypothetical protein